MIMRVPREGVLMVVVYHGPGHVRMMLERHAAICVCKEGIARGRRGLDMVGRTEHAMVRCAGPG